MILFEILVIAEIFFGTVNSEISTGNDNLGKIINGRDAKEGEFPYQVQIVFYGFVTCGGSIIDEYHIITAAHCVLPSRQDVEDYSVVAGVLYKYDYENPHRVELHFEKIYTHKDYMETSSATYNDIAIVRLKDGFKEFTDFIRPVPLNREGPKEVMCNVTGWGKTDPQKLSESLEVTNGIALQVVEVPIINGEKCKEFIEDIPSGVLCAGYAEGGKDACQGDSGGPLVCEGKLVGIVSYGAGCAQPKLPGVYTNVAFFQDWIVQILDASYEEVHLHSSKKT